MVNSERRYIGVVADDYVVDGVRKLFEGIKYGVTLLPNAEKEASPDENTYIYVKRNRNLEGQIDTLFHELFGHGYFYELKCSGYDVDPIHRYSTYVVSEWNDETQEEEMTSYSTRSNNKLEEQIKHAVNCALQNYNNNIK